MVDPSTVAFGLVALIGVFLTLRLTFIRSKILALQTKTDELVKQRYAEFENLLGKRRKADRDPQQGLNIVTLYIKFVKLRDDQYVFYTQNKKHEALDIVGIISFILLGIINYPYVNIPPANNVEIAIMFIHIMASMYLLVFSFYFFISSIRRINKTENQLGIGRKQPTP